MPLSAKEALPCGAANRDAPVFEDAAVFDVERANGAEHIGFGGGIHAAQPRFRDLGPR